MLLRNKTRVFCPNNHCLSNVFFISPRWSRYGLMRLYADMYLGQYWSSNLLWPVGNKPLSEALLTNQQWIPVTHIWEQFYKRYLSHQSSVNLNLLYKIIFKFAGDQRVQLSLYSVWRYFNYPPPPPPSCHCIQSGDTLTTPTPTPTPTHPPNGQNGRHFGRRHFQMW